MNPYEVYGSHNRLPRHSDRPVNVAVEFASNPLILHMYGIPTVTGIRWTWRVQNIETTAVANIAELLREVLPTDAHIRKGTNLRSRYETDANRKSVATECDRLVKLVEQLSRL